jgi:hypothetical protein
VIKQAEPVASPLRRRGFKRVAYLGSGVFKGLAREAALKMMELSDGAVVTCLRQRARLSPWAQDDRQRGYAHRRVRRQ